MDRTCDACPEEDDAGASMDTFRRERLQGESDRRRHAPGRAWRGFARRAIGGWTAVLALACATSTGPLYAPDALRAELRRRLPDVPAEELVVPFEVPAEIIEQAKLKVGTLRTDRERARALVDLLSDRDGLALSYRWAVNNSAQATVAARGGNCLGLSSLLVGLARAVGLRAFYLDATRDPERREEATLRVAAGHVAVLVLTPDGPLFIDFTGELPRGWRYRRMNDLQATAHYYNNLGYEIIHRSLQDGTEVPWQLVQRQFARATRIAPGLATAWNNVGVAASRLGRREQAERSYQRASLLDPELESPRENLAVLRESAESAPSLAHSDSQTAAGEARAEPLAPRIAPGDAVPEESPNPTTPELRADPATLPGPTASP